MKSTMHKDPYTMSLRELVDAAREVQGDHYVASLIACLVRELLCRVRWHEEKSRKRIL